MVGLYLTQAGLCAGTGREAVYDCRPGNRVRYGGKCVVWGNLLDKHIVLEQETRQSNSPASFLSQPAIK